VCANVGRANNMNKLSLVGMQLPEKYKENFHNQLIEHFSQFLPGGAKKSIRV
jgi:hypothetical protein